MTSPLSVKLKSSQATIIELLHTFQPKKSKTLRFDFGNIRKQGDFTLKRENPK